MNLYSGYLLGTEQEGYLWIDLDSVKLAKMDENSRIGIRKSGKELEIEPFMETLPYHLPGIFAFCIVPYLPNTVNQRSRGMLCSHLAYVCPIGREAHFSLNALKGNGTEPDRKFISQPHLS